MLLLVAAIGAFWLWDQNQKGKGVPPVSGKNVGGQPSQRSQFSPASPPRVDFANQPWYGGNMGAVVGAVEEANPGLADNLGKVENLWSQIQGATSGGGQ